MADPEAKLESIVPIFQVADLRRAIAHYRDCLDFELAWSWSDPPLAAVCRDRVQITLAESAEVPPRRSHVYLELCGVEAYHRRIAAAGAEITVSLTDRPYGMRDFRIRDPDGNEISIGEPIATAGTGAARGAS